MVRGFFAKVDIKKNTIIGKLEGINIDKDGPHVLWMNEGKSKFQVTNELRFINHHKKTPMSLIMMISQL